MVSDSSNAGYWIKSIKQRKNKIKSEIEKTKGRIKFMDAVGVRVERIQKRTQENLLNKLKVKKGVIDLNLLFKQGNYKVEESKKLKRILEESYQIFSNGYYDNLILKKNILDELVRMEKDEKYDQMIDYLSFLKKIKEVDPKPNHSSDKEPTLGEEEKERRRTNVKNAILLVGKNNPDKSKEIIQIFENTYDLSIKYANVEVAMESIENRLKALSDIKDSEYWKRIKNAGYWKPAEDEILKQFMKFKNMGITKETKLTKKNRDNYIKFLENIETEIPEIKIIEDLIDYTDDTKELTKDEKQQLFNNMKIAVAGVPENVNSDKKKMLKEAVKTYDYITQTVKNIKMDYNKPTMTSAQLIGIVGMYSSMKKYVPIKFNQIIKNFSKEVGFSELLQMFSSLGMYARKNKEKGIDNKNLLEVVTEAGKVMDYLNSINEKNKGRESVLDSVLDYVDTELKEDGAEKELKKKELQENIIKFTAYGAINGTLNEYKGEDPFIKAAYLTIPLIDANVKQGIYSNNNLLTGVSDILTKKAKDIVIESDSSTEQYTHLVKETIEEINGLYN